MTPSLITSETLELKKSSTVKLANEALLEFGIKRMTKKRTLERLEEAGVIKVEPKKEGAATTITLLCGADGKQ